MRAISPNRQTGVATHVFSRSEELRQAGSPPKSTRGSLSPLQFGQDLVKAPCRRRSNCFPVLISRRRRSTMIPGKPSGAGVPEDEQQMRAELFSVSQLEQHARALASLREIGPG